MNASGDVYVVDAIHNVVDEFSPTGAYMTQVTGAETPAQSFGPFKIAVNASGDLYVTDIEYAVVDEFGPTGTYLTQITGSKTPQKSTFYPWAVAVNGSGDVYVSDAENNLVDEFSSAGAYLTQFNGSETPAKSFAPYVLGVNASGDIYVGDAEHAVADVFKEGEEVVEPPSVTGVVPDEGSEAAGTKVTIKGEHLEGASAVEFGALLAAFPYLKDTATEIEVETPAHAPGAVEVCVTTSGGKGCEAEAFTYVVPPPTKYSLTVTKNGTGSGTVECNTGSGPGPCAAEYTEATKVKLTETAAGGSKFEGWSGACTGNGSCEVEMTAAKSLTATFNLLPATKYSLTVTKNGTGSGTLECNTGSGPGPCASEYDEASKVKLTATAAAGSKFEGWSGACTGNASCEVEMTAAKSVTATFNLTPPANTGKPVITGKAQDGYTLSATEGAWTGSPESYAYQWEDCAALGAEPCVTIVGAEQHEYTLTNADVGDTVRVAVTAKNAGGSTPAESEPTAAIAPAASGEAHVERTVEGEVPKTLTLAATCEKVVLGPFIPGVEEHYEGTCGLTATSTAAQSKLTAEDPSPTHTGHLVQGSYFLLKALEAKATAEEVGIGGAFEPLTEARTLLRFAEPFSVDNATVTFNQPIGKKDGLHTGTYAKTITLTLSTTTP